MDDSNEKCGEECCSHKKCGEHCGHGFGCYKSFFFVRWLFGFIILAIVFAIGVSIGEFKGEVGRYGNYGGWDDRGYSKMMQYGSYNYGPGMMRGYVTADPTTFTYEALPATTKAAR